MEWISVKDELPYDYQLVLVLHQNCGWVNLARYIPNRGFKVFNDHEEIIKNPNYWIAVPEKPKRKPHRKIVPIRKSNVEAEF